MKHTITTLLISLLLASLAALHAAEVRADYDVIVAGAGTGGCGAAIQAARMGAAVLLLEETDWLGGQTAAAGVTSQDYATPILKESGLYREFCERIKAHYLPLGKSPQVAYFLSALSAEPRVAQEILRTMLTEAGRHGRLDVVTQAKVTRVARAGNVVTGITAEIAGQTRSIRCRVLVDATEWGDVIPLTGLNYRTGNGTRDVHKPDNEIQHLTWTATIRKYPGRVPEALVLTTKPPSYDSAVAKFEKVIKPGDDPVQLPAYAPQNRPWFFSTFISYRAMPDSQRPQDGLDPASVPVPLRGSEAYRAVIDATRITRTHLNQGNDYPVHIRDLEDPASRKQTLRAAQLRTLQLLYHLQQTLGHTDWSVADDEGYDTPHRRAEVAAWIKEQPEMEPFRELLHHFAAMEYARESRRIIGLHTLTAAEIERRPGAPRRFDDAVALSDYMIDLHGSQQPKFLELDLDVPESIPAKAGERGYGPFGIPLRSFIPEQLDGFLAAEKNFSQSRLANGATRLQPSTMLMGQAVGALAALSARHECAPRAIAATLVQRVLLDAGCLLHVTPLRDIEPRTPLHAAVQLCAVHGLLVPDNGWFRPNQELAAQDRPKLLAEAPPHLNRGEAAFLIADILQHEAEAALGKAATSLNLHAPRTLPASPKEDLTARYLTEPTNWWMPAHTDFRKWKEPPPKKADPKTDATRSIRPSKGSIK
jgi:hypothetical protein